MTRAELKRIACRGNRELPRRHLVMHTFGNLSVADLARGEFAIKPSGVPYVELTPGMMVVLDLEGRVVEGKLRPSSDAPTHSVLYRSFPGVSGVMHTHSTHATAWAQACRPIPCLGTTHADFLPGPVPCTELMPEEQVRGDYEAATGLWIVRTFTELRLSPLETPMVLVGGHGPFAWGMTAEEALDHGAILEELARIAILTLRIDPAALPLPAYLTEKHFRRKHGQDAYYGQEKSTIRKKRNE
jgi:L-ribulose-5-phosphate 4-epimerase